MNILDRGRKREYCETLGVPLDANEKTVKKAYHRLALELHPDRPQNRGKEGIEHQFKRVAEAYEHLTNGNHTLNNLKNSLKSEDIHSSLEHFFFTTKSHSHSLNSFKFNSISASDFSNSGSGSFSSRGLSLNNLDAKLPSFSSNGQHSSGSGSIKNPQQTEKLPRRGQSLKTTLHVTFEEGVNGCTKILEFTRSVSCKICEGSGMSQSFSKLHCRDCGGAGSLTAVISGMTPVQTPCPTCSPIGDSKEKCSSCGGVGKVTTKKTCTVEVPAGVVSGSTKVFHGQGDEGINGGEAGDFIVCFEVEEHRYFRREGDNVYCTLEIPFTQAALGASVEVVSIYGKNLQLQIENGIQNGQFIKVKGEGFPNESNGKGDFLIQIIIQTPPKLLKEERDLLQKLSALPSYQGKAIQK